MRPMATSSITEPNIKYYLAKRVQGEIVYSRQGTKREIAGKQYEGRVSYLNFPIMAQYQLVKGLHVQTGPQFAIVLKAKTTQSGVDPDRTRFYQTLLVEWATGARYFAPVGLGVDARYNVSLMNAVARGKIGDNRNQVWQLGVFYQFSK